MNIENKNTNKDNRTIIQRNEFLITNLSIEKQLKQDNGIITTLHESYNDIPLTIDLISRGYEVTDKEVDTINRLNANELLLLNVEPTLTPIISNNSNYYISEDGRVFKCVDGYEYYGLNMETMQWENNQIYMDMFYNSNIKYSELLNFRDYYSKEDILEYSASIKF